MVRALLYILVTVLVLTFLRAIVGLIGKTFSSMLEPDSGKSATGRAPAPKSGGELKRDPVCGTFVSTATSLKKTVGKQVLHFCSPACRDQYEKR